MKRSKKILSLILPDESIDNTSSSQQIQRNFIQKDNDDRELSSPLPDGVEETYILLRDVFNDTDEVIVNNTIKEDQNAVNDTVHLLNTVPENVSPKPAPMIIYDISSPTLIDPSPFNIETTTSFENSPMPVNHNSILVDCLNIPTPMPSPLNHHSKAKCQDVFCTEHECWLDSADNPSTTNRKSRKRARNVENWYDVKRKCRTNMGKSYISKRGKLVDEKLIRPACQCRYKCSDKITPDQRLEIFRKFWSLADKQKQWAYVIQFTLKIKKKRCINSDEPNNRKFTYKYFLPVVTSDPVCAKIDVCKTMFLNTLGISGRVLQTAWSKYDGTAVVEEDQRGRHKSHKIVLVDEMIRSVCDHVKSFQPVESHYLREKSTKLYLDGSLSIARMFTLYKEWFNDEQYSIKARTERQYRDIVNDHFNLAFFVPKKDQCDQCHIFKNLKNPSEVEQDTFAKHQDRKKIARAMKTADKESAKNSNGEIVCAVFDFEKVLTCPHGQVSIFYYKRKLSCLNFTIFDMGNKHGTCYMWDETIAKRGANDVSSCLIDFIDCNVQKGVREFLFWSDNCAGQNRNRIVYSSYIYASKKYKVTITHRFMEKGHTQNEGDSVHACIENASRAKIIYTPQEWQLLVRWSKNNDYPYEVKNMTQEHFYDFKSRVVDKVWSKNCRGQKVNWNNIKEVHVDCNDSNKLYYKYDLSAEMYDAITIGNTTRNSRGNQNMQIKKAYNQLLPISRDKYKDLLSLCNTNIIPVEYHDYFKTLPNGDANTSDDEEN
ncbi:uncharacterized protein LOC113498078 [Trichoplusia ni]|uniref:Uncharacterized protein LOC113498078 n=1 Tax=Trichoplusia ni TaxID=7111 RepID=A0A7E5VZR8_TRINI|nr:uncharacterized protein LOC113498078 [Trichoplusia ni]